MPELNSIQGLLTLRKQTRAVTEVLRTQMTEYLATLTPLLRPRTVLGDYVQGGAKESSKRSDKAYKELVALYEEVARSRPFLLDRDLKPPLDLGGATLEISPVDYRHVALADGASRALMVRSPLRWVVTYTGMGLPRLTELLSARTRNAEDLQRVVLHSLALNVIFANQPGVAAILEALHFKVGTSHQEEFGPLPIAYIGASIRTERPPDDVLLQSAELSGMDAFEEVVTIDDIHRMDDPLKGKLLAALNV
jgi:hypothetical protein